MIENSWNFHIVPWEVSKISSHGKLQKYFPFFQIENLGQIRFERFLVRFEHWPTHWSYQGYSLFQTGGILLFAKFGFERKYACARSTFRSGRVERFEISCEFSIFATNWLWTCTQTLLWPKWIYDGGIKMCCPWIFINLLVLKSFFIFRKDYLSEIPKLF